MRCAGRGCQHAASQHGEDGLCRRCSQCRGYATRRPHFWRENACETWFLAHHTWWLAREAACMGYDTEEREFEPQPTFKEALLGLAGSTGGPRWST